MKIDATFLGKRFYIGSYKGQDAIFIEREIEQAKEAVRKAALKHFEDLAQDAKDRLEKTKPSRLYRKFPNLISAPPAIAPPVITSEPVTRRRRQEPEPPLVVEPEPEPVSAPQAPYVRKATISDSGVISKTPLFVDYDWENKLARDPSTDKFYDLNQYESVGDPEHDMDHIYWYDPSTNKFAFKTYNA